MNKRVSKTIILVILHGIFQSNLERKVMADTRSWNTIYEQSFENIEEGELPEDFFVLDGDWQVITKQANKCLVLAGEPVGEHGFLFGPRLLDQEIELSFSSLGGFKSRRHNVFAGAFWGIRGFHFRLDPSTQNVLFSHFDEEPQRTKIYWSSKDWMDVRIRVSPKPEKKYNEIKIITSKRHQTGIQDWNNEIDVDGLPRSGKCALWGFSYAESEMYWDDIKIQVRKP